MADRKNKKQKRNRMMDGFQVNDIDIGFGGMGIGEMGSFDMGFSKDYHDDDLINNNPRAPMLISENYDEPNDMFDVDDSFINGDSSLGFFQPKIPKLTETMGDIMGKRKNNKTEVRIIRKGKRTPLTDEEADQSEDDEEVIVEIDKGKNFREVSPRSKFIDWRIKQLQESGTNFLDPREEYNYKAGYTYDGERYDTRRGVGDR